MVDLIHLFLVFLLNIQLMTDLQIPGNDVTPLQMSLLFWQLPSFAFRKHQHTQNNRDAHDTECYAQKM